MLRAMIQLSRADTSPPDDAEAVPPPVAGLQTLAEYPAPGDRVYVLESDPHGSLAARPLEVDESTRFDFPFIKPSGSQSPQIGPVIKRGFHPKKGVSPGRKILGSTLRRFAEIAAEDRAHSSIYRAACELLRVDDGDVAVDRLLDALGAIDEKQTVFVSLGSPPGCDPAYAQHLLDTLREQRYRIAPESAQGPCAVCGAVARLGANALRGAGLNFVNLDRDGAFPGLTTSNADRRFAVCGDCADALRVFKLQVAPELKCRIAGQSALVIPHIITGEGTRRTRHRIRRIIAEVREGAGTGRSEDRLLRTLAEEDALVVFHVLWAILGQDLDDVTGFVSDVPNTRLRALADRNRAANSEAEPEREATSHPWFPRSALGRFDLNLSLVGELLRHPGGARAKKANASPNLAALRRDIARAVYTATPLRPGRLFEEIRSIAADWIAVASEGAHRAATLWKEGRPGRGGDVNPTAASWVRHVAHCLHYLRTLEVLDMTGEPYVPKSSRLAPYFGEASGIDTEEKAFVFLVGILFGKLMKVQAARRVNVQSNALTWLRRGTLSGRDLPHLYGRIRSKLLEYGVESSRAVGEVVHEASEIGVRLGDRVDLDAPLTMYYLMLGQALVDDVLPSASSSQESKEATE